MFSSPQLRILTALVIAAGVVATGIVLAAPSTIQGPGSGSTVPTAKSLRAYSPDAAALFRRVYGRAPNQRSSNDATVLQAYASGLAKLDAEKKKLRRQIIPSRRGCPLSTALVQKSCGIPAAVGLTLHPKDCEVDIASDRYAMVLDYASGPLTAEQWEEVVQENTEDGKLASYPITGLGDRAILFGSVPTEKSKGLKDLEVFGFIGSANLYVAKGPTAHVLGTRGQQQRYFVPVWCSPSAMQVIAKKILR